MQLVMDNDGLNLRLAVEDPKRFPRLEPERQQDIMYRAIVEARGFFEGSVPLRVEARLTIKFIGLNEIRKTEVGKVPPYVNERE